MCKTHGVQKSGHAGYFGYRRGSWGADAVSEIGVGVNAAGSIKATPPARDVAHAGPMYHVHASRPVRLRMWLRVRV